MSSLVVLFPLSTMCVGFHDNFANCCCSSSFWQQGLLLTTQWRNWSSLRQIMMSPSKLHTAQAAFIIMNSLLWAPSFAHRRACFYHLSLSYTTQSCAPEARGYIMSIQVQPLGYYWLCNTLLHWTSEEEVSEGSLEKRRMWQKLDLIV